MATKEKAAKAPATSKIRIEYEPLDDLRKWPGNPKDHDLNALGESFDEFGFVEPIVVDERAGMMVAGHGRLEKLQRLKDTGAPPPQRILIGKGGQWLVPVIRGVSFKNDRQAERYVLASNRIVELGGRDGGALAKILSSYKEADLTGTGFDSEDVVKFMSLARGPHSPANFPPVGMDLPTEHECPKCGYQWSGSTAPRDKETDGSEEEEASVAGKKKRAGRAR